jgi:hypothetical protein
MLQLEISEPNSINATAGNPSHDASRYPNAYVALPPNRPTVTCPHTGLRHAHLLKLLKPGGLAVGKVRVVYLREPGARHGKTLYHLGDMLRWLDQLAAQPAVPKPN